MSIPCNKLTHVETTANRMGSGERRSDCERELGHCAGLLTVTAAGAH